MGSDIGSLAALSILSGTDALSSYYSSAAAAATTTLTNAQRKAQAQFTTPATTAPWKAPASTLPVSVQVSSVLSLTSVVDKSVDATLPTDVSTSFTTYKALDRLRVLAESAAADTTSSADRTMMEKTFAKGLSDLQTYLGTAPSDKVDISFGRLARQAQTVGVDSPSALTTPTVAGQGVSTSPKDALAGLTGNETLRVTLSANGGTADTVTVDLSKTPQPPTLNSVSDALTAAIRAVPRRDTNGNPVTDSNGQQVSRWSSVSFTPNKFGDKWGLQLNRAGFENVSLDQVGAGDAIMVAGGVTPIATGGVTATRIARLDDPTGTLDRQASTMLTATDSDATARLAAAAAADTTGKTKAVTVNADVTTSAIATDAQGFSYVVGTTAGDVGANKSHDANDLLLTKVDSEGQVVWQRTLGAAGSASGAAVTVAPDGGIVVAGAVTGKLDGNTADGDMLVSRYDAMGNETFSTAVRSVGVQSANAVAVGADGTIYVGGTTEGNGGDAFLAKLSSTGKVTDTRRFGTTSSDTIRALAIGGDGNVVALTSEGGHSLVRKIDATTITKDLGSLDLGGVQGRALAVAADGRIAVAGAVDSAAGRDAVVARIDAGLGGASTTKIGTAAEDQADSVAFMGGSIYVGGRTAGVLDGTARTGKVDSFVSRVDAATGTLQATRQFGAIETTSGPVQISAIAGGDSVLGALGLHRGTMTPTDSATLEAQTSLRAGDEFSLKLNNGAVRKITIDPNETLTTLAGKVRTILGATAVGVTTPFKDGGRSLRIDMMPGNELELIAGASGKDALAKLGLDARRIATPADPLKNAPAVQPGGSFALDLTTALRIDSKTDAANALAKLKDAVSQSQSAYRSLYWDDTKAQLANGPGVSSSQTGSSTAIEQAQLANYQAALTRLSAGSSSTSSSSSMLSLL